MFTNMKIVEALENRGLMINPSPGDGHCLLHSIISSLFYQHRHHTTMVEIKNNVWSEITKHQSLYLGFLTEPENTSGHLMQLLKGYLDHKQYNTSLGDMVPVAVANSMKINVHIINQINDEGLVEDRVCESFAPFVNTVYLHRTGDHFNGLQPSTHHVNQFPQNTDATSPSDLSIICQHEFPSEWMVKGAVNDCKTLTDVKSYSCLDLLNIAFVHRPIRRSLRKMFQLGLWRPKEMEKPIRTDNLSLKHQNNADVIKEGHMYAIPVRVTRRASGKYDNKQRISQRCLSRVPSMDKWNIPSVMLSTVCASKIR